MNWWNFLIKSLYSFLSFSENGISSKIKDLSSLNKLGGLINESSAFIADCLIIPSKILAMMMTSSNQKADAKKLSFESHFSLSSSMVNLSTIIPGNTTLQCLSK